MAKASMCRLQAHCNQHRGQPTRGPPRPRARPPSLRIASFTLLPLVMPSRDRSRLGLQRVHAPISSLAVARI
jgi:hypothetical protein